MSIVTSLFDQTQLAEAAYADFSDPNKTHLQALKDEGMSTSQATDFLTQWQVGGQYTATGLLGITDGTGFSGTLFQNQSTGEYTLALRGTAGLTDLLGADAGDIVADGLALDQIVDMYNYWQSLTHTGIYQAKQLVTMTTETAALNAAYVISLAAGLAYEATLRSNSNIIIDYPSRTVRTIQTVDSTQLSDVRLQNGTGTIASTTSVTVDGHSLGGHLAMAFSRLFPNVTVEVIAVNGAGFGSNTNVNHLFSMLGGASSFDASKITNAVGSAAMNLVSQDWLILQQPAGRQGIFTESYSLGNTVGHGSGQMTDSLAVYDLFFRISPSLRSLTITDVLQRLEPIFAASAVEDKGVIFNAPSAALENIVNAFGKLYVPGYTPISNSQLDDREVLYTKLDAIRTAIDGKSATVTSLVDQVASQVISKAHLDDAEGLAYRYALTELNPFVLLGVDYNNVNSNNELDRYDPDTNEGSLTDIYLADRAAMLSWIIKRNNEDSESSILDESASPQIFRDKDGSINSSGISLFTTEIRLGSGDDADRRHFTFGSKLGEEFSGGNKNDHLYGMGGNDTLNGGKGNDYLEGNSGQDSLDGGEGNDILLGGEDVDILVGGGGNDQLKGGEGIDVYDFNGNSFGTDVITDSDGQGIITINDNPMTTATKKFENIYKQEATGYTFTKLNGGNTIVISKEGDPNRIIVNDWSETKNLSISLEGEMPAAPAAVAGLMGDFKKLIDDNDTAESSDDSYVMTDGNYTRDPNALNGEPGALDLISGTDAIAGVGGNDAIYGLGGSDALSGKSGNDYIDGGAEGDVIQGGLGKDTLIGGAGDDSIYGSSDMDLNKPVDANFTSPDNTYLHPQATGFNWTAGYSTTFENGAPNAFGNFARNRLDGDDNNVIDGGVGNDFIAAGTGADYVHGGADNDVVWGMDKDDILFGDSGNDVIYGDGNKPSDSANTSVVWALPANHGSDIIDGGDGNDILYGQGKNDIIFGGEGKDKIWGDDITEAKLAGESHGDDYLDGGEGDDQIRGGGKNDSIYGGIGDDTIWGDDDEVNLGKTFHGNDYIEGGTGNDTIYGNGGNDSLLGGIGNDSLLGGEGDDTLIGGAGADTLIGGNGVDTIYLNLNENDSLGATQDQTDHIILDVVNEDNLTVTKNDEPGNNSGAIYLANTIGGQSMVENGLVGDSDYTYTFADGSQVKHSNLLGNKLNSVVEISSDAAVLFGGKLDDYLQATGSINTTLYGGQGNDILVGGISDDIFYGGLGSDTYMINAGGGIDHIYDSALGDNTLHFGAGITANTIKLRQGSFLLDLGNGDQVHIAGFNSQDAFNSISIGRFEFADGSVMTASELLLKGFDLDGTNSNDNIIGTNVTDRISGFNGPDTLDGGDGDDFLYGGSGNDLLHGGSGIDQLDGGSGNDILDGGEGADELTGGSGNDYYIIDNSEDKVFESLNEGVDTVENFVDFTLTAGGHIEKMILAGSMAINGTGNELSNYIQGNEAANVITGSAGDDELHGGLGNDTYAFALDDGVDVIDDSEGFNSVAFGEGIALQDLNVSQYQGDDGSYYLYIQYGPSDSVAIKNGLAGSIQNYLFSDGTVITHTELIGSEGIPLHASGTDNDDTLWGSESGDILEGNEGNDELIGLGNDDTLYGDGGSDTLIGGVGNDILDGGLDDDQLIGGAGEDSYVMRWGMGQDTVIDGDNNEVNTIQLDEGIAFSELGFIRTDNDLFLHFRGGEEGLLIEDYYSNNSQWNIRAASGEETTVAAILASNPSGESLIEQAINNYVARAKSTYYRMLGLDGYVLKSDNLMHKTEFQTSTTDSTTYNYRKGFSVVTQETDDSIVERISPTETSTSTLLSMSTKTSYAFSGKSSGQVLGNSQSGGIHGIFIPFQRSINFREQQAYQAAQQNSSDIIYTPTGAWWFPSGIIYPPQSPSSSLFSSPQTYTTSSFRVDSTKYLEKIKAGDSDNYIEVSSEAEYTSIDAGAGNDTILISDYRIYYTPWGYDYFTSANNLGTFLYGNDGNDSITGAGGNDTLVGGSGNDIMDGGRGADTYYVYADQSGSDFIMDSAYITTPYEDIATIYMDWYYRSIGIDDWHEKFQDQVRGSEVTLPPLPFISPTDFAAIKTLSQAGVIEQDTVEFGTGITLSDLTFKWGQIDSDSLWPEGLDQYHFEWQGIIGTLDISWGPGSLKIALPIFNPGSLPASDYDEFPTGANWLIGAGIEQFKFSDGTLLTLGELVAHAPPMPINEIIEFDIGIGQLTIPYLWKSHIEFNANIQPDDISYHREGVDLLIKHDNGIDQLRLINWYSNLDSPPLTNAHFNNEEFFDLTWTSDDLTALGETIEGTDGDDELYGSNNDNTISGGAGNDTLDGGPGNDYLDGGIGNDVYVFGSGSGQDIVSDYDETAGNVDSIKIVDGITTADVTVTRDQDNLYLSLNGGTDGLTLQNWFYGDEYKIEQVTFSDGTVWDMQALQSIAAFTVIGTGNDDYLPGTSENEFLYGLEGNDQLYGQDGNDTLDGGPGNDYLDGGIGNDVYVFGSGSGQDIVSDYDETAGNVDSIKIVDGITTADVTVTRDQDNLYLSLNGGTDGLTLQNWFYGDEYKIEQVTFSDGTVWDMQALQSIAAFTVIGTGNDDYLPGTSENEFLYGLEGNDQLYGQDGNDTLDGGPGNDYLDGGIGNDVYVFGSGSGQDIVSDYDETAGNVDSIKIVDGITTADVTVTRDQDNLYLSLNGGTDRLTLQNWFYGDEYKIEQVVFADGTVWDEQILMDRIITAPATEFGDIIFGSAADEAFNGLGGDDEIYGEAGNDSLNGGDGSDYLDGGDGNDILNAGTSIDGDELDGGAGDDVLNADTTASLSAYGGEGNDTINSGAGDDYLEGGEGNDLLNGGSGGDGYGFYLGDGVDTITDISGNDTLYLGYGINPDDIIVTKTGDVLTLSINGTNDQINIQWSAADGYLIEHIQFSDETEAGNYQDYTVWDIADIESRIQPSGIEVIGTAGNDTLIGGNGDDTLDGGAGADRLAGGLGNDGYWVDRSTDKVIEDVDAGLDTVNTTVTYTLGANVENLTLLGTTAISGNGNELNNLLTGNSANNTLNGKAGQDTMLGGLGNDTYTVDDAGDVAIELADEGTDRVNASVSFTLGDNIENLTLTGTNVIDGTGNELNNAITGNAASNILSGLGGNDTLTGGISDDMLIGGDGNDGLNGGLGADQLIGGLGNDTYTVDDAGDVAIELADEGTDRVNASVSFTLGDNIENLTLTGTNVIDGTGNELNNAITGNAASNILSGLGGNDTLTGGISDDMLIGGDGNDGLNGGLGADQLIGGLGNDTYTVDDAGDVAIELADEGTDRVNASVSFTLGDNIENLTLTGTNVIDGTGNELNNAITGNAASNILSGLGGNDTLTGGISDDMLIGGDGNDVLNGSVGADLLIGGDGNDAYTVDDEGDTIVELANEGTDKVNASASHVLSDNVENLTLTGTANISGTGNALNNVITGNAADNQISGADGDDTLNGGAGNDALFGDAGNDSLVGGAGNDTLSGGLGNDVINGGAGNDTYLFARGDGMDTLTDSDAIVGNSDTLRFGLDVAYDQIWFKKQGNNLELSVIGTTDKVIIRSWFSSSNYHVEQIETADGHMLLDTQIQNLVNAMAGMTPPAAGQTTLPLNYQTQLAPVLAANWQ